MSHSCIAQSGLVLQRLRAKNAFTLIELLLGVTLSAILMTGIVVFVSGLVGSGMTTKKALEDGNKNENFEQSLTEALGNITGSGIYATGAVFGGGYSTGIFFATGGPNLPITFLGLKTQTGYCDNSSGTASETGTVMLLALRQFSAPSEQDNAAWYTLSSSWSSVFSGATRIIGTGYPGNILTNSGTDTQLSSPTALISSGTRLYIADTMNDRILSYDVNSRSITKLLGPENGIRKPTNLYFSGSTLLIASSWNGRIYRLQDGEADGSIFSSTFRVAKTFSADTLKFAFSWISNINTPTVSGSFSLSGFTQNSIDTVNTGSFLIYSWVLQPFNTGTLYEFDIKNISPLPTAPGNYAMQVDFRSNGATQYSDVFPYYTVGDSSLESMTGNILTIVSEGLSYPHNITAPMSWSGTLDWSTVLQQNPSGNEILSYLPIQDFAFQVTGKMLTLRYREYTYYDCMLGKHRTEEKIRKVLLP